MTDWGPCQQPGRDVEVNGSRVFWCSAHTQWAQKGLATGGKFVPDRYYAEKVCRGLTSPTWDWMTDEEAETLLNGRHRGDGRRLDAWVAGDQVGWTGL